MDVRDDVRVDVREMWDFGRPEVSEQRFREALTSASTVDAPVLRTQLARALGLQRRFDEAAAELDAVAASGDLYPEARVYLDLERGRLLNSSGHRDGSRPHFVAALEEAERAALDHLAADAAHMLAIVEPGEGGIPWAERALAIAEASADPRARTWVGSVTHNLGWTLHDLGRFDEALRHWRRALEFREEQGDPELIRIGRWTVARGLRSLGRLEEALAIQRDLHDGDNGGDGDNDADRYGYVEEELGELLLALGRPAEAGPHFAKAYELLSTDEWLADSEPERLKRLAELGA